MTDIITPIERIELPAVVVSLESTVWTFLQPGEEWDVFPLELHRTYAIRVNLN